jgi:putative aldouronate transport system permease protein
MVRNQTDRLFDGFILIVLIAIGLAAVLPLMYVFSVSITPISEVLKNGGFLIIPKNITFDAYRDLLNDAAIPRSLLVTLYITVVGTLFNMVLTTLLAYPLSRKKLIGRQFFLLLIVFTMLFSGGIIPTYLIVKQTGLLNSVWAMIIPSMLSAFNMLIMKSFFENLPEELFDSAKMDGAREFRILFSIVLPLSMPVIMTVSLFYMVGHWNEFFQAIMYVTDSKLYPIQVIVHNILLQSLNPTESADKTLPSETLQMASVIIATIPIIMVYPFMQRYFIQGMLIGSIKG